MSDSVSEYCKRKDHRQHSAGVPQSDVWMHWMRWPDKEFQRVSNRLRYCGWMDKAWTVMLYRQGLIPRETAKKLLVVLADSDHEQGWGGEDWIKQKLGGDEDTASAVNLGRTLQEPMARMQMREKVLDVIDLLHKALETTLDKAEEHADTMMAGQSHMSHAQPTTYGAYMVAVHDGLTRGLAQLELAYRFTNMNSGGCGACSGTGWNVDRQMVTDLLGFDAMVESAYDCEGSQDEIPQILYALSSIGLTLCRTALDHSIWSLEEVNMLQLEPAWMGVSSFMPQKAHTGSTFENIRRACNPIFGEMMAATTAFKGEAIQDNMAVYQSPPFALRGCCQMEMALGLYNGIIPATVINVARMREIVESGYSGAPDLAIKLIRDHGFGPRQAHRICANCIRMARERGIGPREIRSDLLDEAARLTEEPEPHLPDEDIYDAMALETFFDKHCNLGDPCPSETRRMVGSRRTDLEKSLEKQTNRRARIEDANRRLAAEIEEIVSA